MADLLRQGVLQPVAGVDFSNPGVFIETQSGFPVNMRYQQGEIRKREGTSLLGGNPVAGPDGVMHLANYTTDDEAIILIRYSRTKVERYVPQEGVVGQDTVWDDITGSFVLSGEIDDYFDHTIAENLLISTNGVDNIFTYLDSAGEELTALGGSPPKARYVMYLEPYLVAGYLLSGVGKHIKVQWTDNGDVTAWTGGNSGSALLSHGSEPLRGMRLLNEFGIAYKKNSIYLGRKVATSDVIKWDLVEVGTGLINHRSVVGTGGRHYFMGHHDFHVFNGVRTESIGKNVRDEVFGKRNADNDERHFALLMEDFGEVWFYVTPLDASFPTDVWKFNYKFGFWYHDTVDQYRTATQWFNQSSLTIDQLIGTIDAQAGSIDDSLLTTNAPTYVFGKSSGATTQHNPTVSNDLDSAILARFDSKDFFTGQIERYGRWLMMDLWAAGSTLEIFYSTEFGDNWKSLKTVTLDPTMRLHRIYLDVVAEQIRFRFENKVLGETFTLRGFQPYFTVREAIGR